MEQGTLVGTILAWVLLFIAMCFDFGTFQVNVGNLDISLMPRLY